MRTLRRELPLVMVAPGQEKDAAEMRRSKIEDAPPLSIEVRPARWMPGSYQPHKVLTDLAVFSGRSSSGLTRLDPRTHPPERGARVEFEHDKVG